MSQLYALSSPVRSPRPRAVELASPQIQGGGRQGNSLRYRNVVLPPPSPKRLHVPSSPNPSAAQNGIRDNVAPAASYSSREETTADAQARREDEEHGSTQLILLLTLSVVLLTLPWVVDHPVTLLVPVALFILPITSGALRSLVSEGFSLISGGVRWFWRHRNASRAYATVHSAAQSLQSTPQTFTKPAQPAHARQPSGAAAFAAPQQPEPWKSRASQAPYPAPPPPADQQARMTAAPLAAAPSNSAQIGGGCIRKLEWQPAALQRPHAMLQPTVVPQQQASITAAAPPELSTPDLDFDSDSDTVVPVNSHGCVNHASVPYRHTPFPPVQAKGQNGQSAMHQCDAQYSSVQRPAARFTEHTECTVYNWDDADECTQRRGHRPLSNLLNNVQ